MSGADDGATTTARGPAPGAPREALRAVVLQHPEELEAFESGWDALAVAAARPYCAPGWLLAWWRHVAPAHARLRTVVVLDGDGGVAGVAPYFAQRAPAGFTEYRLLGAGTVNRLGPLARAGSEEVIAQAIARALAGADPRPRAVRFEGVDRASPWPRLLADAWPARLRPWTDFDVHRPTPYVTLTGGDFDAWLAGRSRNFRQQARRTQRKVAQAGGTMRLTSPADDVERDVANFVALHLARWSWRGGSGAITGGVEHMLREAARELVADGRLRLWTLEIDGAAISSHLFVAAGGEVAYFNGGFDERWADLKPSMHAILVALEDCFARGDRRMDLGLGVQPYKQRLADGDDPTAWIAIFPRDLRYPYTRAQALPAHLGSRVRAAGRRLPPDARERVRRLLGHAGGRR